MSNHILVTKKNDLETDDSSIGCSVFSKMSMEGSISSINKQIIFTKKELMTKRYSSYELKTKKILKPNDYLFLSVFTSFFCFLPFGNFVFKKKNKHLISFLKD